MHDFGAGIILNNFGTSDELISLDILKKRIYEVIEQGKRFEVFQSTD